MALTRVLATIVLPPSGPILLGVIGCLLLPKRRRPGVTLLVTGVVLGYVFSIPFTANVLSGYLQTHERLTESVLSQQRPDAIVVLAGGLYENAPEYPGDTVDLRTLGRVRYAARLARQTGLPLLASGGIIPEAGTLAEGELMQRLLQEEFGIDGVLAEGTSQNTRENAANSAPVLRRMGVDTILLVTNAAHMPRAVEAFQLTGLKVIAAPTLFFPSVPELLNPSSWLPSASSIGQIYYVLYEFLGRAWYRLLEGWV